MSGYLQRLFDRTAAMDTPVPSSPSQSPVAQADQRLLVPGIGDALMFQALSPAEDAAGDVMPSDMPENPEAESSSHRPSTPEATKRSAPPRMDQAVHDAPVGQPSEQPSQPFTDARAPSQDRPPDQQAMVPVQRMGAISDEDFERPQPDSPLPGLRPDEPHPAPSPPPPARDGAMSGAPETERSAARPVLAPPAPVSTDPPNGFNAPNRTDSSTDATDPPRPSGSASPQFVSSEQQPSVVAQPAPVPPPIASMPDNRARADEETRSETVREIVREIVRQDAPSPPQAPSPPRPMTATEVSVIGSLPESRRAYTLFGVRRR